MSDRNRKEFLRTTGMNGQAYAKVSAFFLPLVGASAHMQTRKAPKTFHHLLSLRNAHFIEGRHECPPVLPWMHYRSWPSSSSKSTSRYSRVDSSNSLAHPQFV